ncbi:fungal-specific transcription factor domain-containing protein [Fusarium tricinctum]|uniref:Fungal-specific transcription factor domain-containing protein n=1 Tax=Fusarium tricinctum TaxID=61284 RepID=A0A8K0RXX5_9HYPO|nr:fungal-specific transcription factor domain-containing protein [Fusarium tricinctum]
MNATKWRISKACQECRAKKIKCNGETPCQNCRMRNLSCVYREKARNRTRKVKPRTAAYETIMSHDAMESTSLEPSDEGTVPPTPSGDDAASIGPAGSVMDSERSLTHNSVAATHRASPSCFLQLYYGPSSNFALLNSIYHQIAGICPNDPPSRSGIVEEGGQGLDLFNHRRLFFGDLADNQRPTSLPDDCSAMLINPQTAHRLLERYLLTYWHCLPVMSKDDYRRRLDALFQPPGIFDYDEPETIIIMLAVGLGASMTGEEAIAEFLFQKTKQGAAKLDEVVNMQVVQIHLLMGHFQSERARPNSGFLHVGTACRKAVAAGLHKDGLTRPGYTEQNADQRRIIFWSLFFWETWHCFVLGRPSSIPDPGPIIPLPKDQKLLKSLVTLSRIMNKCVKRIYSPRHDSLLPVWNAAVEIRRELHQFAEQQLKDMKFGLVGDPSTGELGVCQAMVSTIYHHTLLLTFRPFLILRAKLNRDQATAGSEDVQMPPPWLDSACEYCLEAARNSVGFLTGSCATNVLCHDIKYHGFFIEGACYALAFDMLQEKKTAHRNLPWIHSGLRTLRSMMGTAGANPGQLPITIASIEQMVRSAGFELKEPVDESRQHSQPPRQKYPGSPAPGSLANGRGNEPAFTFPSMPFGFDVTGQLNGASPAGAGSEDLADFTAADVGWDIDFGTMNMEAFLSLDSAEAFNFAP